MTGVFADTSFYVAALNPRDVNHAKAEALGRSRLGQVFTTEYVLLEVATFLCKAQYRTLFLNLHTILRNAANVSIIPTSADL